MAHELTTHGKLQLLRSLEAYLAERLLDSNEAIDASQRDGKVKELTNLARHNAYLRIQGFIDGFKECYRPEDFKSSVKVAHYSCQFEDAGSGEIGGVNVQPDPHGCVIEMLGVPESIVIDLKGRSYRVFKTDHHGEAGKYSILQFTRQ